MIGMIGVQKKLIIIAILLATVFLYGILGYMFIEGWKFLDSAYMTMISLFTVGYGETNPLSSKGRIFTMSLLVMGIGTLAYGMSTVTAFLVEGQFSEAFRRKRMEKQIEKLQSHYIVCGLGDVGMHVIDELIKTKSDFVVIELDMGRIEKLLVSYPELLYLQGNATSDEVLIKAGVERAKGLVSALPSDSENLFLVLSAKELNTKLRIVSRAADPASSEKIKKAGAESVVLPEMIGGLRIASLILRPNVVSFLDIMLRQTGGTVRFGEVVVNEGSELAGATLAQAQIPQRTGLVIIAIREAEDKSFIYNPKADIKLNINDALVVIGTPEQVATLQKIAKH